MKRFLTSEEAAIERYIEHLMDSIRCLRVLRGDRMMEAHALKKKIRRGEVTGDHDGVDYRVFCARTVNHAIVRLLRLRSSLFSVQYDTLTAEL